MAYCHICNELGNIFFTRLTYALALLCQAYSGMVVAVLIKCADNIVKGFSSAASIVLSSVGSWLLLHDLKPGV